MPRQSNRWIVLGLVLLAGAATDACARSAAQLPGRAVAGDAAKPDAKLKRSLQDIVQELQQIGQETPQLFSSETILTEAKRTEAAAEAIPVLKRMNRLVAELRAATDPLGKAFADRIEPQLVVRLAVFGDTATNADLQRMAKSADRQEAVTGTMTLLQAGWITASHDAEAQKKLLSAAEKLAKENPENEQLTGTLFEMSEVGPASPELAHKAQEIASSMKTRSAQMMQEQVAAEKRLRSMEYKPLIIEGVRNDGTQFTTADWKGKVILVDFWATWCNPCRDALPQVKKAYADFHDKGLEVLGVVSGAYDARDLSSFLDENKDMPWPELFDAKSPGLHPLAKAYGITFIPIRFLIDRKGVLRSITGRENFEEMVQKLLAEQD